MSARRHPDPIMVSLSNHESLPRYTLRRAQGGGGFIFMDLLCTTAIILTLACILFPVFARAREKGRGAVCQSNLKQIGMALQVYATDNFGHFPPESSYPSALMSYLQEEGVLECPSQGEPSIKSYVYRGGFSHDDAPTTIIGYDCRFDVHNDGFNTLWLDGHVKWLSKTNTKLYELGLQGKEEPLPRADSPGTGGMGKGTGAPGGAPPGVGPLVAPPGPPPTRPGPGGTALPARPMRGKAGEK